MAFEDDGTTTFDTSKTTCPAKQLHVAGSLTLESLLYLVY